MNICEICGKPAVQYPNVILTHGHCYHVGCMASAFEELRLGHAQLVHRAHVSGWWGPWCDGWEGSFDQKHWGDLWLELKGEDVASFKEESGLKQVECFYHCGRPARGGKRRGSALCQQCYEQDIL